MRCADKHPVLGEAVLSDQAREPEVGEIRFAIVVHQDIAGLDVAVEDVAAVGGRQRRRELRGKTQDLRNGERPTLRDSVGERPALDPLHGDVGSALVRGQVIDPEDVRVGDVA